MLSQKSLNGYQNINDKNFALLLLYESLNFNYDCIYPYFEENYSGHSDSKYIHTRRLKEDLQ